jgi:hypothetical protein
MMATGRLRDLPRDFKEFTMPAWVPWGFSRATFSCNEFFQQFAGMGCRPDGTDDFCAILSEFGTELAVFRLLLMMCLKLQ